MKPYLKDALGFGDLGYITLFKGNVDNYTDWFKRSNARYAVHWGWYIPSDEQVPEILPEGVSTVKLEWDNIVQDGELLPPSKLKAVIADLIYEPSESNYVGAVGDKVSAEVVVIKATQYESQYGASTLHVFEDEYHNQYVWATTAKQLPIGSYYILVGTVKEHSMYKNIKQTVLTRCRVEEI